MRGLFRQQSRKSRSLRKTAGNDSGFYDNGRKIYFHGKMPRQLYQAAMMTFEEEQL